MIKQCKMKLNTRNMHLNVNMISSKVKPIAKNNLVYAREDGTMPNTLETKMMKNNPNANEVVLCEWNAIASLGTQWDGVPRGNGLPWEIKRHAFRNMMMP